MASKKKIKKCDTFASKQALTPEEESEAIDEWIECVKKEAELWEKEMEE